MLHLGRALAEDYAAAEGGRRGSRDDAAAVEHVLVGRRRLMARRRGEGVVLAPAGHRQRPLARQLQASGGEVLRRGHRRVAAAACLRIPPATCRWHVPRGSLLEGWRRGSRRRSRASSPSFCAASLELQNCWVGDEDKEEYIISCWSTSTNSKYIDAITGFINRFTKIDNENVVSPNNHFIS